MIQLFKRKPKSPCCNAPVTNLINKGYFKDECSQCHAVLKRYERMVA
jgi:hypothetical protein